MITKQLLSALWQTTKRRIYCSSSAEYSNDIAILQERDAKPGHYLLKIESFNELSENLTLPYMIKGFKAGGYEWELYIYPKGDEENDGKNHVSMYLQVADTDLLPHGWEINATFNFFIYDHIRDKYIGLQDARKRCFQSMKNRWGVPKFIDLKTFNNSSKGFLINDTCILGVEVFISCIEERLKMIHDPERICKYKWEFDNFSKKICDKCYKSDFFVGGDYKWRLLLNPNCHDLSEGSITIGLEMNNSAIPPNNRVVAIFCFRLVNQTKQDEDIQILGSGEIYSSRYTNPMNYGDCILEKEVELYQRPYFISLAELQDPKAGYLVNDTCILEVEIDVLALHSPFN